MSKRVLFYVQHLVGVGHVFRATRIVRALRTAGMEVDLVFGGFPIPDLDAADASIHYLPPVRAGVDVFNKLEAPDGAAVDEAYMARRREMLLSIFERTAPDIVVTEAFPFGRRQMRFELIPLMEAARARKPRPVVVASVRDILQQNKKPERDREVVDILDAWFDHVLVHGDPALVRVEQDFPLGGEIAQKLLYTGIVGPETPQPVDAKNAFDVVVSVGGGAFGHKLLVAALNARRMSSLREARWVVLTGLQTTPEQRTELDALADTRITFRTFIPDLPGLLAAAKLSISRVGYNTTADIFAAGCRAIVIPFSDGIETEQIRRAELLDAHGCAIAIGHADETPEAIAAAIDRAMLNPPPDRSAIRLGGAEKTARILNALAHGQSVEAYR